MGRFFRQPEPFGLLQEVLQGRKIAGQHESPAFPARLEGSDSDILRNPGVSLQGQDGELNAPLLAF